MTDLREALELIASGHYPPELGSSDICPHGRGRSEGCEMCIVRYAEAALAANPPSPTPAAGAAEVRETLAGLQRVRSTLVEGEFYRGAVERATALILALSSIPVPDDGWRPSQALADIAAERRRQVEAEGWTSEHDDQHRDHSLALAAACYAMFATLSGNARERAALPGSLAADGKAIPGWLAWMEIWPWDRKWWKPKDARSDLIRAAALIAAEIERLDRAAPLPPPPGQP